MRQSIKLDYSNRNYFAMERIEQRKDGIINFKMIKKSAFSSLPEHPRNEFEGGNGQKFSIVGFFIFCLTSTLFVFLHNPRNKLLLSPSDASNSKIELQLSPTSRRLEVAESYHSGEKNPDKNYALNHIHPRDYLSSNSVILITGAAGLLGSELAMALYRMFSPKKIILVDSLEDFTQTNKDKEVENLEQWEHKRQRIFTVMQTLGNVGQFYKCDLRPSIPEFLDIGDISILSTIFEKNPGITHIVHLANVGKGPLSQKNTIDGNNFKPFAVPRGIEDRKAGMMESIMDELKKLKAKNVASNEEKNIHLPHFVYLSSYEVYDHASNEESFTEYDVLDAPMSLYGTSKLIDELLASTYYELYEIYSVGLRFADIYGPWASPQNDMIILAETILDSFDKDDESNIIDRISSINTNIGKDYIYIDDAVDAIVAAMQFRQHKVVKANEDEDLNISPLPEIFNVGSGKPYSFHEIFATVAEFMDVGEKLENVISTPNVSMQFSIEKAQKYLGFQPQVTLNEGMKKVLAWYYNQRFPYVHDYNKSVSPSFKSLSASHGIQSCDTFDDECLLGAAVFPCTSECAEPETCLPSIYDQAAPISRALTNGCTTVLYTIALGDDVDNIPSGTVNISPNSITHVISSVEEAKCNIAFVSEQSNLYHRLTIQKETDLNDRVQHGFWTLLPLSDVGTDDNPLTNIQRNLPKVSPSSFFSSTVEYAVYADPNVVFHDLPSLLQEMKGSTPYKNGETIMMISSSESTLSHRSKHDKVNAQYENMKRFTQTSIQQKTHNMARVGLKGQGIEANMKSHWIVHAIKTNVSDDARLFRCDIFGEDILWNVNTYDASLNFISTLHDFWTRKILKWEVEYSSQQKQDEEDSSKRRLQQLISKAKIGDFKVFETSSEIGNRRKLSTLNYIWMGVVSTSTPLLAKVLLSDATHLTYL